MENLTEKIESLKSALAGILLLAASPVVLWSGGADSTLLLYLTREIKKDISIVQFRSDLRESQLAFSDSVIGELDLKVFTYAPQARFFLLIEGEPVLVSDYAVGAGKLPVIRDCVSDDGFCALDLYKAPKTETFDFPFDIAIAGWRKTDSHFALGEFKLPAQTLIDGRAFVAPLFDWTRDEILEASRLLKIPVSDFYASGDEKKDTGNFLACANCLKPSEKAFCPKENREIEAASWSPETNLSAFRARFS